MGDRGVSARLEIHWVIPVSKLARRAGWVVFCREDCNVARAVVLGSSALACGQLNT